MSQPTQFTFQLDSDGEAAIEELKAFFGTRSNAAAVRAAIKLARTAVPISKNRTVIFKDQVSGGDMKLVVTG